MFSTSGERIYGSILMRIGLTVFFVVILGLPISCRLESADALQATASASPEPSNELRMTGSFRWTEGSNEREELEARLTNTGPNTWDVRFKFRFNGGRHNWKGQLRGDLVNGPVVGTATMGRGRRPRTWRIEGRAENGVIEAQHFEQLRAGESTTGTLMLRPMD